MIGLGMPPGGSGSRQSGGTQIPSWPDIALKGPLL
jgi:hypothetical protein